ncbi:JAB/MPN domain protein [Gregarina niphandrodes]|uniref:COP9 signalosome complex subunit 5 n=1 Tax=Gregarina niphandrodes TaxID=110365 RepID=A0A023B5A4_GRENI|nr:JAB/MPN domain protein [Gregarina niphandrodes]EZG59051.1 JAB/MPN domain protein [Gregarina niphandrodes]|eukprot:XP_011130917.1 JAB/MPN domain protein [Gregarina niphandrodes]
MRNNHAASDEDIYKVVRVSAAAMTKMIEHADKGGEQEVMGIVFGKHSPQTFEIIDAVALPVQGTDTRITADASTDEWLVNYSMQLEQMGCKISAVGWYHTHPGYKCWLSGIDIDTQRRYQTHMDPWVALVIDPTNQDQIEIGAFRLAGTNKNFPTFVPAPGYATNSSHGQSKPRQEDCYYSIPVELVQPAQHLQVTQNINLEDIFHPAVPMEAKCALLKKDILRRRPDLLDRLNAATENHPADQAVPTAGQTVAGTANLEMNQQQQNPESKESVRVVAHACAMDRPNDPHKIE